MVITPTTGRDTLAKAVESVGNQTIPTEHLIVCDGENAWYQLLPDIEAFKLYCNNKLSVITLPENIGSNGWYGHRVYAAMPLLVNADYILFLDEDNWFEPNHVETMINTINSKDLMWAYALRRICSEDEKYIRDDDCESLGDWPTYYDSTLNFVDTNCYCFKREHLVSISHMFYGQWGADRPFYTAVSTKLPNFGCTGLATVNYRTPTICHDMFKEGNEAMKVLYQSLPWRND